MRILVIGATGFIGRELIKELSSSGHQIVATSRNAIKAGEILGPGTEIVEWDGKSAGSLAKNLHGIEGVVNLAGENIAAQRWTKNRKKVLTESRVKTGKSLSEAILLTASKPAVLIQGSATGFYGTAVDLPTKEDQAFGSGFLAGLTKEWESAVDQVAAIIPRVVYIRTGLVLGKNDGLLQRMILPFNFYLGTILGSGRQWMPWIHISDQVRAIRFLLESNTARGPYNLTAPNPVQMNTFILTMSRTLGKPAWLRVPGIVLKTVLGEMATDTVLASQNIIPAGLLNEGYQFRFPFLDAALVDLLTKNKNN